MPDTIGQRSGYSSLNEFLLNPISSTSLLPIVSNIYNRSILIMASLSLEASTTVDHANDLLVVTCASGKQASALLPNLVNQWQNLRLVCNSAKSEVNLKKAFPKAEVMRADLSLSTEAERVLNNATAIYFVEPPFIPRQAAMGFNMIDAAKKFAKKGTFQHFVYGSVLNPQLRKVSTQSFLPPKP